MPTAKPTPVSANTQLLAWMNKFNDLLDYSSLWDGGQLAKLTEDTGFSFTLASGGNLNNLKSTTKTYVPANAVNSPLAVVGVVNIDAVDANNATQLFTTLSTGVVRKFSRNLVAGTWTAWTEYASTSLASTTNPGLMSPTDKTNLNGAQLFKLTESDGSLQAVSDSTPLSTFKTPGRFRISGTHPDNPNPAYNGVLIVDYTSNGSFVYQWISSISSTGIGNFQFYRSFVFGGSVNPFRKVVDSPAVGSFLMGNKYVDQTVANFAGKVSGSLAASPHTAGYSVATSVISNPAGTSEDTQAHYNSLSSQDGSLRIISSSALNSISQNRFSFNILEHIQRTYGTIPGATTADKVAWLKSNITKLTFNWSGLGSSPGGNKATVAMWSALANTWYGQLTSTSATVTRIVRPVATVGDINAVVDSSGIAHFLAYADASDGTTASVLTTDYIELQVELSTDLKSNLPLATTTTPGAMSPADKALLDGAQKVKLTLDTGISKFIPGDNANNIVDPGDYIAITSTQNVPTSGTLTHKVRASGGSKVQMLQDNTDGTIYLRSATSDVWTLWKKIINNNVIGSTLLGNKFVDQSNANFVGKVLGNTAVNPHISYIGAGSVLYAPSVYTPGNEVPQVNYNQFTTLDGTVFSRPTSTSASISQQLFSFNLIEHVQRTYGTIPGATTADKVAWLKSNLSKLTFNWWGFGSSPTGNKAALKVWAVGQSVWGNYNFGSSSNSTSGVSLVSGGLIASIFNAIDANGFIHFLAYAEASDGTTASVINTDYVELQVELSTDIKSNMPLATTTTPGDMSASDKIALDNAQKVKLTLDTGASKIPPSDDANLIVDPGSYSSGASTKNVPVQYGTIFHIQRHATNFIQMFQNNSEGLLWIRAYNGYWTNWVRSTDSKIFANTLMGNKFVEQTLMSFSNKIAGSTTENPHRTSAIYGATTTLAPGTAETVQAVYDALKMVDLSRVIVSNTGAGQISQQLFTFNLLEHIQRTYGNVPGASTAEKVAWLKLNVSKLTFNWWGFGSVGGTNKANIAYWTGASWAFWTSNTANTPTKAVLSTSVPANLIQADGLVHFLAYAEPSDGTLASTISSDYVELYSEVSLDYGSAMKPQWVTATLQNSWVEFDSSQTPKFNLGKDGFVDMVGAIKLGVLGQTAFTLPVGYRPTKMIVAMGIGAPGNHYRVIIATSGAVTIDQSVGTNGNGSVYLDNLRFPTT